MYDYEGKALAQGANPSFVGQNLSKLQDVHGKYFVKDTIDEARKYGAALG